MNNLRTAQRLAVGFLAMGLGWISIPLAAAQRPDSVNPADEALERGFLSPPNSAKPRVWWHWMNGNITKEGIKLDLEWMHEGGHQRIPEFLTP